MNGAEKLEVQLKTDCLAEVGGERGLPEIVKETVAALQTAGDQRNLLESGVRRAVGLFKRAEEAFEAAATCVVVAGSGPALFFSPRQLVQVLSDQLTELLEMDLTDPPGDV